MYTKDLCATIVCKNVGKQRMYRQTGVGQTYFEAVAEEER